MTVFREMKSSGWRFSASQIQFRNTVTLDLYGTEDEWLKRMKQKTRYNLRLAQRNGVTVREAVPEEYPDLYRMYAETSVRDGFMIRPQQYYLDVWNTFREVGLVSPLVAEVDGEKVAGLVLFHFGKTAWYLYGMSTALHREKMPNYLLQWEAMCLAKAKGCLRYDLWGAPDEFTEADSMAGVFRFKTGLGGKVERTCGAWDFVVSPIGYALYEKGLPWIQNVLRRNRKNETRREVGL
jgi:lipid II:glycine glycyltransferase (peptidoglycan interpeptide bridge formation enzyme)